MSANFLFFLGDGSEDCVIRHVIALTCENFTAELHLLSPLADHYDVKMPCHLILSKLADKCPSAVLAGIEFLLVFF